MSRKGFAKVTLKAGRVSSTFLLSSDVFSYSPYARGLRYYKHFRGPLRLTNHNFHTHIQYCITFYYDMCHIDKYTYVEGLNFNNFGRFGISDFDRKGFAKLTQKAGRVLSPFLLPSYVI